MVFVCQRILQQDYYFVDGVCVVRNVMPIKRLTGLYHQGEFCFKAFVHFILTLDLVIISVALQWYDMLTGSQSLVVMDLVRIWRREVCHGPKSDLTPS
uniref:Uncharacterized protein n=1 Tax=Engystomops pustulosus TaxID=76066 RepID=A0AAV6YXX9_ENGPU|nr:hypothetical protein GDO81_019883 [Engystomops pustulosus]